MFSRHTSLCPIRASPSADGSDISSEHVRSRSRAQSSLSWGPRASRTTDASARRTAPTPRPAGCPSKPAARRWRNSPWIVRECRFAGRSAPSPIEHEAAALERGDDVRFAMRSTIGEIGESIEHRLGAGHVDGAVVLASTIERDVTCRAGHGVVECYARPCGATGDPVEEPAMSIIASFWVAASRRWGATKPDPGGTVEPVRFRPASQAGGRSREPSPQPPNRRPISPGCSGS